MKHLKLFFALFAMLALGVGNAWGAEYELVTSEPSDWSGEYLVVYNKDCFNGSLTTGFDKSAPVDVTISNKKINLDEKYAMIIGKQGTAYSLKTASGYYIGRESSSSNGMDASQTWGTKYTINFTWNATNKTVKIAGQGGKCLGLNSTTWRFYAASNTYVNLSLYKKVESGSTEPVLSATPTEIDFGTVDQGTTVEDKTVTVNFENLTGAVTYSGLSTPFTATGAISATGDKITISADASTIGERSQTLTIQSAADSKTAEVTVRINVEAPFNGKKLDFDFVNHPTGWPVKSNATAGEYVYNLDDTDYTFKHSKSGDGVYVAGTSGTSGYLLIASGNTLGLPAIKGHKLVKVQGTLNNSGSPSTSASVSITDGTNTLSGGTAQTWNTKGGIYTYSLSGTQANTMYYLSVSNKNLQMITLVLYYEECEKYALTITEPAVGTGTLLVKDGENTLTSGAEIYEGTKLTVTATPAAGYEEGVVVVVKNASDEDVTADVYDAGTLTMPAYAVTISATFEEKPCELLAKPTVSATTTYSSAKISWEAIANAAKYSVKVGTADAIETTETSYEVTGLTAETEYTYQVQAIAADGQTDYCDSKVAEGKFTTAAAPVATVTLSDVDGEKTLKGSLYGTITLPKTAAECSKTFVGWSAVEIPEPGEKPATNFYAPGAEYTFTTLDPTLYAVYADENNAAKEEVYTFTEFTQATTVTIEAAESFTITLLKGTASTAPQWNSGTSQARVYAKGSLVISADAPISKIVYTYVVNKNNNGVEPTIDGVSGNNNAGNWDASAKTWTGNDTEVTFSTSGTAGNVGFTKVAVTVGAITYSNYSTTCAAALEKPTFSVAEGTYTEEKSIELNATEGDIYYTLDGTDPTKLSTLYTDAIVLDECGTTTIKAIAISTDSESPVASATYTINLPITNTAATAYTPAEAIAIIDGECDKTEEVFVKGVVVSTSAFSAEYGNYDVIVKAVDDNSATPTTFTFYRMYKAASKTKFTASDEVIGVGDIITAKGKLTKYNSTYELAEGCYMVERVAYTEPKTDISNTLETAYTVDKAFELISDIKSDLDKEVYVKGLVAVASTELYEEKYLTYSISDNGQNSGNVLKVYDGLDINGVAFTSKDDVKVGDYVVVKGKLLNYKGTYEINKDNQLVQHKKAATITIADITMEVGETKTIAATVVPAEATVTYTIKENAANAISLSGNVITANEVGTATITATIETATDYMGNSVDFTVTVGPKTESDEVVILAELDGKWYAMKGEKASGTGQIAALEVTYFNGTLYNVADADKASITWTRTVVGDKVTFANNGKYLKGTSDDTNLALDGSKCEWTFNGTTYTIGNRTFLYRENFNFKNYNTEKADAPDAQGNYSALPVVTAPVYATGLIIGEGENTLTDGETKDVVISRSFTADALYTISLPFALYASQVEAIFGTGTTLYQFSGLEQADGELVMQFSNVTAIAAATPYLIKPAQNVDPGTLVEGVTIEIDPVNIEFTAGATTVTMKPILSATEEKTNGRTQYWLATDNYLYNNETQLLSLRALFEMTTISGMPPRCRAEFSENEETALDYISTTDAPIKVIENGQLIIIRDDVKYNVQGVRL